MSIRYVGGFKTTGLDISRQHFFVVAERIHFYGPLQQFGDDILAHIAPVVNGLIDYTRDNDFRRFFAQNSYIYIHMQWTRVIKVLRVRSFVRSFVYTSGVHEQ